MAMVYILILIVTGALLAQLIIDHTTNPWDGYGY